MSGFKDDVISILRQNSILQSESVGLIVGGTKGEYKELYDELLARKFPVACRIIKPVLLYDYIVLPWYSGMAKVLQSLSNLSAGGILVIQVDSSNDKFEQKYISQVWNFTATKVKYEDRVYIVVHQGVDYGD